MTPAQPERYCLHVRDEVLDDLRERLSRTRWPDEIPESGWQYGSSLGFTRRLIERWRDGFDWRTQEAKLNAFDQFRVPIDGINLHFIHQQGVGPHPVPLLLVHGWPGSVWEFHELIPRLTDPARSFPREIRHPPRSFAEQAYNIQRWTEMPRGGHFAALEVPGLLADDVAAFFRSAREL